ncbi:MAG: DUF4007 family protein [Agriterribacter sp.]
MKLQFSGHESFICKQFWLKKGYDFIANKGNFNDESAVVELGVGKNMVASISYWLKAFGITDQSNSITSFGHNIFNDRTGKDPYIESIGTLWLLHYNLVKTGKASIYSIFFNEFRRGKNEFTKDQLVKFVFKLAEKDGKVNLNTISSDIAVFIRNFLVADYKASKTDIEDEFSNLLIDLELMQSYQIDNADDKKVEWYRVNSTIRSDLPAAIVLYTILDNPAFGKSIPFRELMTGYNSPGAIFALNEEGLYQKIEQITNEYKNIIYKETAGVKEFQIKSNINKEDILNGYYKN